MLALEMMLEALSPLGMPFVALFPNATLFSTVTGGTMVREDLTGDLGIFHSNSPFLKMIATVTRYGVLVLQQ